MAALCEWGSSGRLLGMYVCLPRGQQGVCRLNSRLLTRLPVSPSVQLRRTWVESERLDGLQDRQACCRRRRRHDEPRPDFEADGACASRGLFCVVLVCVGCSLF